MYNFKNMEKLKEKLEDIWFDISDYYPSRVRDFWWGCKRFIRNLKRYRHILWNDNDWDYGYLEEIVLLKLNFMADYFRTSRIAVGTERWYEEILWAIRLGEISMEKENFGDESKGEYRFDFPGYVNTRTIKRFFPMMKEEDIKRVNEDTGFGKMIRTELRRRKARNLFFRILRDYEEKWWD